MAIESHIVLITRLFELTPLKDCFSTKTHNRWDIALEYVKGLLTNPSRCHLSAISDNCSWVNNQSFSHFISKSPWDHRALVDWIITNGWLLIGKKGALVIDECGNPKAGIYSVGVNRQYCGNIGKVENCQVGVFMAYVKNGFRLLLDFRLYLPESWASDCSRCNDAGIPLESQKFKTKAELAYELICTAVEAKIKFTHITMDGFYGGHPWLLSRLEAMGLVYVADISSKDRVILEKPEYGIPAKKGIRGRKTTQIKILNANPVAVEEVMKSITRWWQIRIRESTSGFLEVKFTAIRVWRIDKDFHKPLPVWLLIRKELDDSDIKYSFCNAHSLCTWGKLVKMQSERYWVERSFEDAIALAGMADYQVRNWNAWHHHMALVLLAMLWVTKEQKHFMKVIPKTTPQDIARIIQTLIPLKIKSPLSIAKIIIRNHRNRKQSRRCKMKKKNRPLLC